MTVPRFGLRGVTFSVRGKRLRVRVRNGTDTAVRVRVKGKDTRKSVRAAGTLKAVTKRVKAGGRATFRLKLPASTRRRLAAQRRTGKARYRPAVTVTNLTSGIAKTYRPKIKVARKT